jgi:hypothetical protein
MYRISRNGQEPIIDVEQVEAIEPAIRSSEPGRYHVDEISADPLPSGHDWRRRTDQAVGPLSISRAELANIRRSSPVD